MASDSAASGLPPAARARLAEIKRSGTWGSALSTEEFAALRSVGFEPVGQVLGAAVYNIGYTGGFMCPGGWNAGGFGGPLGGMVITAPTQVSGRGGTFRPLTKAMYEARHKALSRMTAECSALGGHGIVGVKLTFGPYELGGLEFKAIGTAVRGIGAAAPRRPFSSDLSGQDFTKLIMSGWVAAGLVMGISVAARHDDWMTMGQARWGGGNTEVSGYTELVNMARHDARVELEGDVARLGAEGVVIASNELHIRERECPSQEHRRDHIAEVTFIGTAIARFGPGRTPAKPGALAVMSLDPQRRQAARVNLGR